MKAPRYPSLPTSIVGRNLVYRPVFLFAQDITDLHHSSTTTLTQGQLKPGTLYMYTQLSLYQIYYTAIPVPNLLTRLLLQFTMLLRDQKKKMWSLHGMQECRLWSVPILFGQEVWWTQPTKTELCP